MALTQRLVSLAVLLLFSACLATGDTVVFWGRNKYEGSLREACDNSHYTTVVISFLSAFGHGTYKLDISGHPVSAVGEDIKYCQSIGKFVLLAIGGQGGEYSLPSSKAATELHDYLWNTYLRGNGANRPFGDAVVNGIDFFIDQGATEHYDELARLLYEHNKPNVCRATVCVILTATVRCGFPDQRLEAALDTGLFNRIHVKLFGDGRCPKAQRRATFERWAAAYPESMVLLGVVASQDADAEAYIPPEKLYNEILRDVSRLPNFGGVMLWNRYYDKQTNYSARAHL